MLAQTAPNTPVYVRTIDNVIRGWLTGDTFEGKIEVAVKVKGFTNYWNVDSKLIFDTRRDAFKAKVQ